MSHTDSKNVLANLRHVSDETEFFTPMPTGYEPGRTKYVVVFGTVMSGLGKGIFSSSLDDTVARVEGELKLVKSVRRSGSVTDSEVDRRNIVYHEMVVGGQAFGVTPDVFNTVLLKREGQPYAIYFTEKTKMLLSLEPMTTIN